MCEISTPGPKCLQNLLGRLWIQPFFPREPAILDIIWPSKYNIFIDHQEICASVRWFFTKRSFFMKKTLIKILCLVIVLALIGGTAWYFLIYQRDMTAERCAELAGNAAAAGRYNRAIRLYTTACELDPENYDLALALADTYVSAGNYTKAEYTLVHTISDHPDAISPYLALSRIYVSQDKLLDAQQMLDHVENEAVRTQLDQMRPEAPVLSPESGYYSDYISVSLTYRSGTPYLRVDGEYPSTSDAPYSAPVELPGGESSVSAIVVGENGLVSPLAVNGYTIGNIVEEVHFASSAFESFVRDTLSLDPSAPVMTDNLWDVAELTVPDTITEVGDLQYFTGLKTLTLQNYHGGDYSFLESMPLLENLDLSQSSVSTIAMETIDAMQALRTLNLNACGISDVSNLKSLSGLQSLDLGSNNITNIAPLARCTGLQILNLSGNGISDISPLTSLKQLQTLDLSYNAPTTLAPLAQCTDLRKLDLSNCNLIDISAIKPCTKLTHLSAAHNDLTGITGLESCTALEEVDLSYNKLVSINELGGIDSLLLLNINENDVKAVPAFSSNCRLQKFYADHNFLEDLSGLTSLPYLNYVTLDYNNIDNIDALADCENLVQVNVFHTNITSAEAVSALTDRSIIVNYTPDY